MHTNILSDCNVDRAHAPLVRSTHFDRKSFALSVVGFQSLAVISIMLDLHVVRQVVGFLYLTLVPGIVLMRALKLKESTLVEHLSISVGVSISLIMLIGFLTNELGLIIGVQHPLSLVSLLFPLSMFVLVACAYIYSTEEKLARDSHKITSLGRKKTWLAVLALFGLPLISLVGSLISNSFSNNTVLLCLNLGISAVFLLTAISPSIVPAALRPLALFAIALALLLATTMVSQYITGYDLHSEFYCFVLTRNGSSWTPDMLGVPTAGIVVIESYATMLSVTILPLFYSVVLNLSGELIFKVIYPIIFSIIPVALLYVYKKFFKEKLAMLAVCFFVSYATFYITMAYLARQMIAELFFVLLLLLFAKDGLRTGKGIRRDVLYIFFFFGLVVSHYSMTYLMILFVLCFVLVSSWKERGLNKIGLNYLLLLVTLALTWYFFSFNSAAFQDLARALTRMSAGFSDIFGGREQTVLKAIGVVSLPSVWRKMGQYVFYAVEMLIAVGFLRLLSTRRRLGSNQLFFSGTLVSMLLLFFSVVLPNFSSTLNVTRIFQIALFFLAPMLLLGGDSLYTSILRILHHLYKGMSWDLARRFSLVPVGLLIVLFFFFQSGLIFVLVHDIPVSPSMTTDRNGAALKNISLYDSFTFTQDVYGAKWISSNVSNQSQVYGDLISLIQVLRSYGLVSENRARPLTENIENIDSRAHVYLRSLNIIYHVIENEDAWIMPDNSSVRENTDLIYSNGECQVLKGTGS